MPARIIARITAVGALAGPSVQIIFDLTTKQPLLFAFFNARAAGQIRFCCAVRHVFFRIIIYTAFRAGKDNLALTRCAQGAQVPLFKKTEQKNDNAVNDALHKHDHGI